MLLTAGLVGLVYGLIRAGERSWSDTGVIVCLTVAAAALAGFVVAERLVAHPLFDLSLLRTPTFAGGSIAAFAMNGSLYALLLYLVLYLQDILGYSARDAGLRLAIISLAQLVTATIAGRLSEHMPVRWLIGPGLLLVGVGLILMTGLTGDSSWTHLIPGFVIAGFGGGMVNPPLASTAIGVVAPHQAGMASGVNATFRQIGIATGIAALGSIFTAAMQRHLASVLPPSLAGSHRAHRRAHPAGPDRPAARQPAARGPGPGRGGHPLQFRGGHQRPGARHGRARPGRSGMRDGAHPQQDFVRAGREATPSGPAEMPVGDMAR